MEKLLLKIIGTSEYHGVSRGGKPYNLTTLELDYNGDKAKIKCFESGVKVGDYAEICIGVKKSVYGAELVTIVNKIIPAEEKENQA